MTLARFSYQRQAVMQTSGKVLNVGANEDPAGLKMIDPERVVNCDIEATDSFIVGRPNSVDVIMDAREVWPFESDSAELVVFGDILEHLYPQEALRALTEAERVAEKVCITLPRDRRWMEDGVKQSDTGYRTHCIEWTPELLSEVLEDAGWKVTDWQTVDYVFVPEGFFIMAERMNDEP
jgi:predicted SAM-dependent methyltransferase